MATTTVQPYIFFPGNCQEAMQFYANALGGKLTVNTFADSPVEVPADQGQRVMHASLVLDNATIFGSDGMPGSPIDEGQRVQLSLNADDVEVGRRYFEALSQGGTVSMPYEKQFWGDTFGALVDRFGVKWMVNASS